MSIDEHTRKQLAASIRSNRRIQGDYFRLELELPEIPELARAGQFVHVKLPGCDHRLLRRPFSIFNAEPGRLSLVYKVVGEGTALLSGLDAGRSLDVMGPLGNGFTPFTGPGIIVAGGFGCAATYLLAKRADVKPLVLLGGRSAGDILLLEEYRALGCRVEVSTDDGTMGMKGRVTDLLLSLGVSGGSQRVAACGPVPMLKALASVMASLGLAGELSMDNAMCCGVGACYACVTKVRDASEQGWRYARVCSEGPIFPAEDLVWD